MARCPKCSAEIDARAAACPACGWDFPETPQPRRTSWAYSRLADVALVAGMVAALILAGLAGWRAVLHLLRGEWLAGLVTGPLAFLLAFAMFVVFACAGDIARRRGSGGPGAPTVADRSPDGPSPE